MMLNPLSMDAKDRAMLRRFPMLLMLAALFAVGCSRSGPVPANPKKVVPVTGTVHVDGAPADKVEVKLHPDSGRDEKNPTVSMDFSGPDGKFEITTYYQGDGAPPGDYTVTFRQILNTAVKPVQDELRGKYNNPANSTVKVSVSAEQESVDMGVIELTKG